MKKSLLAVASAITILASGSVSAQTFSNGPYYATPSWDQQLPAAQRFIILQNWNNAAVLDRETGLVWQRQPFEALAFGIPGFAASNCILLNVGGRFGWRLPTVQELTSLLDTTQNPTLPSGHPFIGVTGEYWTSTPTNPTTETVYSVVFDLVPVTQINIAPPSSSHKFWCVRGGSSASQ